MEDANIFAQFEEHNCLNELEKLRLANKLALQVLKVKSTDILTNDLSDSRLQLQSEPMNEDTSKSFEDSNLSSFFIEGSDKWGATEYLGRTNFKYVKDYLNRTEKLLDISNSVRHISSSSSYEVVETSDELLHSPEAKKCKNTSDNKINNQQETALLNSEQTNTFSLSSSSSLADIDVEPLKNIKENGYGLRTHRPIWEVQQLPVYISTIKTKISADNDISDKSKASRTTDIPSDYQTLSTYSEKFKKALFTEQQSRTSLTEPITMENISNKCNVKNTSNVANVAAEVEIASKPNKVSKGLSCSNKTSKRCSLQTRNNIQCKPLAKNLNEKTFYSSIKNDNVSTEKRNRALLYPTKSDCDVDNKIIDSNGSYKVINTDVCEVSSDESRSIFISRLNLDSFSSEDEVVETNHDDSINFTSTVVTKITALKPKVDVDRTNAIKESDTKRVDKTNLPPMQNSKKFVARPSSAEKFQRRERNIHRAANRPSTAGKIDKQIQRKWEKSSIAWSSYGNRHLKTWSSIQLNNSSPEKPRNTAMYKKSLCSSSSKLFQRKFTHVPNSPWYTLPDEIIIHIFKLLSVHDLLNAGKVCRLFHRVANDNYLWKNVKVSDFTLDDEWFATTGKRSPESVFLAKCSGKSVTNLGLRNFFKNCKLSLSQLAVENCSGEYLTGDAVLLHASCHCRKLKNINVAWSKTTDNGIIAICVALPIIQVLNINGNSAVGDEAIQILDEKHGKNLISLEMSGCFAVTSDALLSLILSTTTLQTLNVGLCSKVTFECIINMAPNLHSLLYLDLRGLKSVNNQCLHAISKHCTALKTLIISNCTSVTDVGIAEIATYRNTLTHFDISGCTQVSDQGTLNFAMSACLIETLDLSSTGATHKTVAFLASNNNLTLQTLKLSFCHSITQQCLTDLLEKAVVLKSLHIYGCKRIKLSQLMKVNNRTVIEK